MLEAVRLALDWAPNTIHAGIYTALMKGYYREADIALALISPESDAYMVNPAKKLSQRLVDMAIAPSESVISYQTLATPLPLIAVAPLLQLNTSAIVTRKESGIDRPAKLDGKVYGSYAARFEEPMIRAMVKADGGEGTFEVVRPPKLQLPNLFLEGQIDATWVFLPWEGVEARHKNVELNVFKLEDYGIPYGYTPTLLTHRDFATANPELLTRFLEATGKGYKDAAADPAGTALMLAEKRDHPNFSNEALLKDSLEALAPAILDKNGNWGTMENERWEKLINWLIEHDLLDDEDAKKNPTNFARSLMLIERV